LTFNGLHGIISQKVELLIITALRTSNPIYIEVTINNQVTQTRNAYRILVGKPEGRRPLGRPRRRRVDNIKIDLRGMGWERMGWFDLAQDRDRWRSLVKTVMNLRAP
jgi:hypothetical protein